MNLPKNTISDDGSKEGLVLSLLPSFLKDFTSKLSDLVFFSEYTNTEIESLAADSRKDNSELIELLKQLRSDMEKTSDKEVKETLSNQIAAILERNNATAAQILEAIGDNSETAETHEEKIEKERNEKRQTDLLETIANNKPLKPEDKPMDKGIFGTIAAGLLGLFGAKGIVMTIIKMLTGKGILATILGGLTFIFKKIGALFSIQTLKTRLIPLLARINPVGWIITGILVLFNGIKEFVNTLFNGGSLLEAIGNGLAGLLDTLTFGLVNIDGSKITEMLSGAGGFLSNLWNEYLLPGLKLMVAGIGEGLSWLFTDGVPLAFKALVEAGKSFFDVLGKAIVLIVMELIPWVVSVFTSGLKLLFDGIATLGKFIGESIMAGLDGLVDLLGDLGKKYIVDPLLAWWENSGIGSFVEEYITKPIENVFDLIKGAFDGLVESVTGMVDKLKSLNPFAKDEEAERKKEIAELESELAKQQAYASGEKTSVFDFTDKAKEKTKAEAAEKAEEIKAKLDVLKSQEPVADNIYAPEVTNVNDTGNSIEPSAVTNTNVNDTGSSIEPVQEATGKTEVVSKPKLTAYEKEKKHLELRIKQRESQLKEKYAQLSKLKETIKTLPEGSKEREAAEAEYRKIYDSTIVLERQIDSYEERLSYNAISQKRQASEQVVQSKEPAVQEMGLEITPAEAQNGYGSVPEGVEFNASNSAEVMRGSVEIEPPRNKSANGEVIAAKAERAEAVSAGNVNTVNNVAPTNVKQVTPPRPYVAMPVNNSIGRPKVF